MSEFKILISNIFSKFIKSNLGNRPPWRPGGSITADARSRAMSRTSTYVDDQGNRITSKMIKERKAKSRKGRRESNFAIADLKG